MKINLFNLSIIIIVIFSSCKKENDNQQQPINLLASHIKSVTVSDTSGRVLLINTYYYDTGNRLITISDTLYSYPSGTTIFNYTFEYYTSIVILKRTNSIDNQIDEKIIYNLNSSGLATSSVMIDFINSNDSTIQVTDTYQYNSDGYLITRISSLPGGAPVTASFRYLNKNIESITVSSTSANSKQKEIYSYSTDHINTIGNLNCGVLFLGNSSYNPMIKAMDSTNYELANYNYNYDMNKRISRLVINGNSSQAGSNWISMPYLMSHEILTYTYY